MKTLEQNLKELASKMTKKPIENIPNDIEGIVNFLNENYITTNTEVKETK